MNIPLNVSNVSGEEQALQAIKNKQTLQRNPAKPNQQVLKQHFFLTWAMVPVRMDILSIQVLCI